MPFVELDNIETREIMPGFHGKLIHTDRMTFAFWRIEAGAVLPEHQHPHEQVAHLTKGKFELTVAGETRTVVPGQLVVIPGDTPHSGKAFTECEILDVFQPIREDYR